MKTINIQAKTHLSRLVDQASKVKPFVIAKAGKPLVKVTALDTPVAGQIRRLGFMAGQLVEGQPDRWPLDPSDRLLIAQSMVEGITMLTADPVVAQYPGSVQKV
jgi:antitoxin (DNA-binding transcriptional repressor) of toxin-antitoxin stability system